MDTIDHFCTALVLNATWQVPSIAAAAALAARPRAASALRYRVWLAAALLASALPVATAARLVRPASGSTVETDGLGPAPASATTDPRSAGVQPLPRTYPMRLPDVPRHWAAALLLTACACRVVTLARAARAVAHIRRATVLPTPLALAEAQRVAASTGLSALPVRLSTSLRVPITIGAFAPVVVLPEALARTAARPLLRYVLAHEAEHVRRRDLAWQWLVTVASLPVAFHPVTWRIAKALDASREQACDDAVAVGARQRRDYARALVAVAARALGGPAPRMALAAAEPATLEGRVARLLRPSPTDSRLNTALAALLMSLTFLVAAAYAIAPEQAAAGAGGAGAPADTERVVLGLEPNDGAYRYDTLGRRDPFRSPHVEPDEVPIGTGLARYRIADLALRGIVTTPPGSVALLVAPDARTYFARVGQRLRNGIVTAIDSQGVLFHEDVDDPLATVRSRNVRWLLHGERATDR
jgi:beta-lactamase regulating signal transducer with metallopeptidase domain